MKVDTPRSCHPPGRWTKKRTYSIEPAVQVPPPKPDERLMLTTASSRLPWDAARCTSAPRSVVCWRIALTTGSPSSGMVPEVVGVGEDQGLEIPRSSSIAIAGPRPACRTPRDRLLLSCLPLSISFFERCRAVEPACSWRSSRAG